MKIYLIQLNGKTVAVEKTDADALDVALGTYLEQIDAIGDTLYSFKNVVKKFCSGEKIGGVQILNMEV